MKTTILFQQALPYLTFETLDVVPQEAQALLISRLNAAVSDWFANAPDRFKFERAPTRLTAPTTVSVSPVKDSTTLAIAAFDADEIGRTVVIAGDTTQNMVVGPSRLILPYTGDTPASPVTATLYDDVIVFFDEAVERVVSRITCRETGLVIDQFHPLGDVTKAPTAQGLTISWNSVWLGSYFCARTTASHPRAYSLENLALSQIQADQESFQDSFLLRLDPIPTAVTTLDMEISRQPRAFKIEDFRTPKIIPVPDSLVATTLFPMFLGRLTSTPYWKNEKLVPSITAEAADGKRRTREISAHRARPNTRIRTQAGF